MSAPDARITLAVAFTLREIYRVMGVQDKGLYTTTDELVAALDDRQVREILDKLTKPFVR